MYIILNPQERTNFDMKYLEGNKILLTPFVLIN